MKAFVLSDGHEMMFPWQQNQAGGTDMVTWKMTRTQTRIYHVFSVTHVEIFNVFKHLSNTSDCLECNCFCGSFVMWYCVVGMCTVR